MAVTQYYGTGRRKTAIARVFLRTGSGKFGLGHHLFADIQRVVGVDRQLHRFLFLGLDRLRTAFGQVDRRAGRASGRRVEGAGEAAGAGRRRRGSRVVVGVEPGP